MSKSKTLNDYDWTRPLKHNGKTISGGAARQVRVAQQGGITNMCKQVADDAANFAIQQMLERMNQPTSIQSLVVESVLNRQRPS